MKITIDNPIQKINKKLCEKKQKKIRTVISCIYDGTKQSPTPIGFSWAETLATKFKGKYNQTILLHGETLKYGLQSDVYKDNFGTPNPFESFLHRLSSKYAVKIVICDLCLNNDGFNQTQLLPFIKPITFSIDFIAQSQANKHAVIVYDAQIKT
jgi:hypothetical protein